MSPDDFSLSTKNGHTAVPIALSQLVLCVTGRIH